MSILGPELMTPLRGVRPDAAVDPLSIGLVIGIGGSGIQTVARVKSAVLGARPDAAATPSVQFLGIDAVGQNKQVPPLPPGVSLGAGEFVNLTDQPFDANAYISRNAGNDNDLAQWWDNSYVPPVGPLVDGLKASRMLGRLAFYREGQRLVTTIAAAANEAVALSRGHLEAGIAGTDPTSLLRVFVVSSSCGGTGSSGTLEVLYAVWAALHNTGITPQIRLLTFLPGVFETTIRERGMVPELEISTQRGNAFAFFRELDHFADLSSQLARFVAQPTAAEPVDIPDGNLVHSVIAIDATVEGAGRLSKVTDAYEIAAEMIYQFLMTDAGRPQVAQNGTNTDVFLTSRDIHAEGGRPGKTRRYCGIGVAAITYPGATFRRSLAARLADWIVRKRILARPVDLPDQAADSVLFPSLRDMMTEQIDRLVAEDLPRQSRELRGLALTAAEQLAEEHDEETAGRFVLGIENGGPKSASALEQRTEAVRPVLQKHLREGVRDLVLGSGLSVPVLNEVLRLTERHIEQLQQDVAELRATKQQAAAAAEKQANELHVRFRAVCHQLIRTPGTKSRVAKELGEALQSWGNAMLDQQRAQMRAALLRDAAGYALEVRQQMTVGEARLGQLAADLTWLWQADDLIGKDAGPVDTTSLIPSDAQPQVDQSAMLDAAFTRVVSTVEAIDPADLLRDIYRGWPTRGTQSEPDTDGLLSLGSTDAALDSRAMTALRRELQTWVDRHALQTSEPSRVNGGTNPKVVLPRSLEAAAAATRDGLATLDRAIDSLSRVAARSCWSWSAAAMGESRPAPSSTTVIIRPLSLANRIDDRFDAEGMSILDSDDEERIVAITTEWGVSAHALSPVDGWRRSYERSVADSAQQGTVKRPHLDRRFHGWLNPLQPLYFKPEAVMSLAARAFALTAALTAEGDAREILAQGVEKVPLKAVDNGGNLSFVAVTFTEDEDTRRWAPSGDAEIGGSYGELQTWLGRQPSFRQSADPMYQQAVTVIGRPAMMGHLTSLHDRMRELAELTDSRAERAVIELLAERADFEVAELRKLELAAGTL